jgi:hypothetical protein
MIPSLIPKLKSWKFDIDVIKQHWEVVNVLFIKYLLLIKTGDLVLFLFVEDMWSAVFLCPPTFLFSVAEWCSEFTYSFHPEYDTLICHLVYSHE